MGLIVDGLKAIGAGAAGAGAVDEERRRRARATADPDWPGNTAPPIWTTNSSAGTGTSTGTQAVTQARSTTACKKCPPDCGSMEPVKHHMNEAPSEYQARITGFPPGTEWKYMDVDFDGFRSIECLLLEAKGNYDQFLVIEPGFEPKPKFFFYGFVKMRKQVERQWEVVSASRPARCNWYFQTPHTYELMSPYILNFPPLQAYYQP